MARVSLYVAWVNSSLLSHSNTPYGVSIIAFGLGYLIFAMVWLYVVWRDYIAFGLGQFTFVIIWLLSGASIIAFGLGYLIFAIVWLYVVWLLCL